MVQDRVPNMDFTCLILQRSTSIFSGESDSKYFRPVVHLVSVTTAQLCGCFIKAAVDTADKRAWLSSRETSSTETGRPGGLGLWGAVC